MTHALLEVDGLWTAYGQADVLRGVSCSLRTGAITCLLGPNGAGKTTLLMSIAGLARARSGAVRFAGADIAGQPAHAIVARGIALVPEDRQMFAALSVADNLMVGAHGRRDGAAIRADLARIYARFPRLRERAAQRAGTLSGGEQQILAMARAMMSRPRLLMMDEPSRGLAPLAIEDMLRFIEEINAGGTSIFLVEQNPRIALGLAHDLYVMEHGRITFHGAPSGLPPDELVRCAYLGAGSASPFPASVDLTNA
jgi:branched-chain amino acid transport system ATP-binding protein